MGHQSSCDIKYKYDQVRDCFEGYHGSITRSTFEAIEEAEDIENDHSSGFFSLWKPYSNIKNSIKNDYKFMDYHRKKIYKIDYEALKRCVSVNLAR